MVTANMDDAVVSYLDAAEIDVVELRLADVLMQSLANGIFPRVMLGFSTGRGDLDVRRNLRSQDNWRIVHTSQLEGKIGKTFASGSPQRWRRGDDDDDYKEGDARTTEEFCYPVKSGDDVVAVLLVDFFSGEEVGDEGRFVNRLLEVIHELEEILSASDKEKAKLRSRVTNLTQEILSATDSLRGYTAVRGWDGSIEYFPVGEKIKVFRELNFEEGLSGHAFSTRSIVNLGNVWRHPKYLSSDDRIVSEIVVPLIDNDQCIGVLNLESVAPDAYLDSQIENNVVSYANQIALAVQDLLKTSSEGTPQSVLAAAYLHSQLVFDDSSSSQDDVSIYLVERYTRILSKSLDLLFGPTGHFTYEFDDKKIKKKNSTLRTFEPDVTVTPKSTEISLFIARKGILVSELKLRMAEKPNRAELETAQALARIVSNDLSRKHRELKTRSLFTLVSKIAAASGTASTWLSLPHELAAILEVDDVTCFNASVLSDGATVLLPVSSNGRDWQEMQGESSFYDLERGDSLTSVAMRAKRISVYDRFQSDTLANSAYLLKGSPTNTIVEDGDVRIRAAMYIPIWRDGSAAGLIRLRRRSNGLNRPFLPSDAELASFLQRVFVF